MDIKDNIELENWAQQLHRPVMSLKDFSLVSQQDLAWLNQQLKQTIEQENKKLGAVVDKVRYQSNLIVFSTVALGCHN